MYRMLIVPALKPKTKTHDDNHNMNKQLNSTVCSEQTAEAKQSGVDGNSVATNSIVASAVQPGKLNDLI